MESPAPNHHGAEAPRGFILTEEQMLQRLADEGAPAWRQRLGRWVESRRVVNWVIVVILINAVVLGLETDRSLMARAGWWLPVDQEHGLTMELASAAAQLLGTGPVYTAAD